MKFIRVITAITILCISATIKSQTDGLHLAPSVEAGAVNGSFIQTKYLSDLPLPLESTGTFSFQEETGVIWEAQKPVRSRIIIQKDGGAFLEDQNGHRQAMPASDFISNIFLSVFTSDIEQLDQIFFIEKHEFANISLSDEWRISLTPRSESMRQSLDSINLSGSVYLSSISILETNGDLTEIELAFNIPDETDN